MEFPSGEWLDWNESGSNSGEGNVVIMCKKENGKKP